MTTDDSKAALAAALHERVCERKYEPPNHEPGHHGYDCDAAAILAELREAEAEYDRMTRVADGLGYRVEDLEAEIARLRAALRQIAVMPKAHRLVASICEIALAPAPSEP